MKKTTISVLVFSTALGATASAASPSASLLVQPLITFPTNGYAAKGMLRSEVERQLGPPPGAMLAPNVWVYLDFKPATVPNPHHYDALVVVFAADGHVSFIRLSPSQSIRAFVAQQQKIGPLGTSDQ